MSVPEYTPHFCVVGGPADDGGVVLLASKAIKDVKIVEELLEAWLKHPWRDLPPPEYEITFHITLDYRTRSKYQYEVFWAPDYPSAFQALFNAWGADMKPDNPEIPQMKGIERADDR